jgi:hypothetical protein
MLRILGFVLISTVFHAAFGQAHKHGLIALYHFTGNADDSSGNGYHGSPHAVVLSPDRHNRPNSAYFFNGNSSYIDIGSHELFNRSNADYTVSAWVKLPDGEKKFPQTIMSNKGKTPDGIAIVVFQPDSSQYAFRIEGGKSASLQFAGEPFDADTNWHLLTYSFEYRGNNRNPVKIYVDGVLNNSGALRNVKNPVHGTFIGFEPDSITYPGTRFHGNIDDISIYDRVLSEKEVNAQFTGIMLPKEVVKEDTLKKKKSLEEEIGIFPNPSIHKAFFIVNNYEHNVQVSIVNEDGKVVYKSSIIGNSRNKVALRDCLEGNYVINIRSLGGSFSKRIILQ